MSDTQAIAGEESRAHWRSQLCGWGSEAVVCNSKPTLGISWGPVPLRAGLQQHTLYPSPTCLLSAGQDLPATLMHYHFWLGLKNLELGKEMDCSWSNMSQMLS